MPVKSSQSGARILSALEKIGVHQPIGVSELARLLETNVAAAQRAIATLADEGWIRNAPGRPVRWELTAHILTIAQHAYGSHDLRRRARAALEELWRETGESVLLNVPDGNQFVVIEVFESPHYLRTAPPIGLVIPAGNSATGRAILPYFERETQAAFLGGPPDAAMLEGLAETVRRGFSISFGDVVAGSTNIAAPIFESDGRPVGAVLLSAPTERASDAECGRIGAMVAATARRISRGAPRLPATE